jgi:hypothetical protein
LYGPRSFPRVWGSLRFGSESVQVRLFIVSVTGSRIFVGRGANYCQAGRWTTGYPLITPGSSRGVPSKVSKVSGDGTCAGPTHYPPRSSAVCMYRMYVCMYVQVCLPHPRTRFFLRSLLPQSCGKYVPVPKQSLVRQLEVFV